MNLLKSDKMEIKIMDEILNCKTDLKIIDEILNCKSIEVGCNIEVNEVEIIIPFKNTTINNHFINDLTSLTDSHNLQWYIVMPDRRICIGREILSVKPKA